MVEFIQLLNGINDQNAYVPNKCYDQNIRDFKKI